MLALIVRDLKLKQIAEWGFFLKKPGASHSVQDTQKICATRSTSGSEQEPERFHGLAEV